MTPPRDPFSAVTHCDPYPYYADLVARSPFYRDESLSLWVAVSAEAVKAVLTHERGRVRPPTEPVPKALIGSPAGDIFRRLVRMNDGAAHVSLKQAVSATLASLDASRAKEESAHWARTLVGELEPHTDRGALSEFALRLPVYAVTSLLGVPRNAVAQTAQWAAQFARGIAPGGSADEIESCKTAASLLLNLFGRLHAERADGLLGALTQQAGGLGRDNRATVLSNGIGFLSQTYEATAGLIGNTLVALARHGEVLEAVAADTDALRNVLKEVLRFDPPIQNTRRFLVQDAVVAGQAMKAGDAVLVVLAAANRDPALNPHPERFDLSRADRRMFTLGAGLHACPGEALAVEIARTGVEQLLAHGLNVSGLADAVMYRPSVNARVPLFATQESRS